MRAIKLQRQLANCCWSLYHKNGGQCLAGLKSCKRGRMKRISIKKADPQEHETGRWLLKETPSRCRVARTAIRIVFRISILLPGSVWRFFHVPKFTFKTLLHLWWEIKQQNPNQKKKSPQKNPTLNTPTTRLCKFTEILIICPLISMFFN